MKNRLIFLFLTLCICGINAQVRPHIQVIIQKIAKSKTMNDRAVGYGGSKTEVYKNYEQLRDKATIAELVIATNNPSLIVKAYAGWALADRNYVGLQSIFQKYLAIKEEVTYFSGCTLGAKKLSDLLYEHTHHRKYYVPFKSENDSLLHFNLVKQLDSVSFDLKSKK